MVFRRCRAGEGWKMEQSLENYERKILSDKEFPIQVVMNRQKKRDYIFRPHWHEHIELHYVLSGHMEVKLDQQEATAEQGDLVVINSNVLHSGYCDGTPMETLVLIFEMEALSHEFFNQNILYEPLIYGDPQIKEIMLRIYRENEERAIGYRLACKGALMQLLVYLSRNYGREMLSDSESMKRTKKLERLNTVNQYIEKHYTEQVSNKELAELLHLSEDRFNHLFKEGMGMPPLQYINEVRLKKAMNLLKKGEYTASEVADVVGFSDYNHFGRMFRRYFGCTPMQARKKTENSNIV